MNFSKLHGFGNDFVVFDFDDHQGGAVHRNDRDASAFVVEPSFVRMISHRKRGIGFDQLILLKTIKRENQIFRKMVFVNADGSFAEMCGNGLRAAALFDLRRELLNGNGRSGTQKGRAMIAGWSKSYETDAGPRLVTLLHDAPIEKIQTGGEIEFEAEMGVPSVKLWEGKRRQDFLSACSLNHGNITSANLYEINVGNPHLVVGSYPSTYEDFKHWGATLEQHPQFPMRTNVEFFKFREISPAAVDALVWERGVGPTDACGTGAVALGIAALEELRAKNSAASEVEIHFPGGKASVFVDKRGVALLRGTAAFSFEGQVCAVSI